jgi:fructose-bisphosphate aldolase class 1
MIARRSTVLKAIEAAKRHITTEALDGMSENLRCAGYHHKGAYIASWQTVIHTLTGLLGESA